MQINNHKGGISVDTEHIFPIIKKWLYSEKDIFLREIVSNAQDAITKLLRLSSLGKYDAQDEVYKITVSINKEESTLTVDDNGIGMSLEDVKKYICQIALSGALDFIREYEGENESSKNGIIGHFGLGFYSSFMVSTRVDIDTLSYDGSPAVHWSCTDTGEYTISDGDRDTHGTRITMHISPEENEYLDPAKIRSILNKYCAFMPIEIYFDDGNKCNCKSDEVCSCGEHLCLINDTNPIWMRPASECSAEQYKEFYHKVFSDINDPLFWIHINADYPLNFKGVLFFPKFKNEYDAIEGQVKLYYNQVFVADNIKEAIPEYLLMLKGVLDCPELPLNVSRSYLQTNTYVSKLSAHISKKVADKLNYLKNNEFDEYVKVFEDIKPFIQYSCLKDRKFYDRVKNAILFKLTDDSHLTLDEYIEQAKETNKNVVYYTVDKLLQEQYIKLYTNKGIKVAVINNNIELQFLSFLEGIQSDIKFLRVDADIDTTDSFDGDIDEKEALSSIFERVTDNKGLIIKYKELNESQAPLMIYVSEESRRMDEMMKLYSAAGNENGFNFPLETTIIINTASPLISKLVSMIKNNSENVDKLASYIYKLARLSQGQLSRNEISTFITDTYDILECI